MSYSTSEQVVGKWVDGRTLYRKTVIKGVVGDSGGVSVYELLNVGLNITVVKFDVLQHRKSELLYAPFGGFSQGLHQLWWSAVDKKFYCRCSYTGNTEVTLTYWYIKN